MRLCDCRSARILEFALEIIYLQMLKKTRYVRFTLQFFKRVQYFLMFYFRPTFLAAAASATIIPRQDVAGPPDGFSITQVSNSGNGCPGGSINVSITPDQTIVLSRLLAFKVSTGPNSDPSDRSKGCAIHASISYPGGWQFVLHQSAFSGHARLGSGVTGRFFTQYYASSNASNTVRIYDTQTLCTDPLAKYHCPSSQPRHILLAMHLAAEGLSTCWTRMLSIQQISGRHAASLTLQTLITV